MPSLAVFGMPPFLPFNLHLPQPLVPLITLGLAEKSVEVAADLAKAMTPKHQPQILWSTSSVTFHVIGSLLMQLQVAR